MLNIPPKLQKFLNTLECKERLFEEKRFHSFYHFAQENSFQSPRFWAMRQVLSRKSDAEILRNAQKRISKVKKENL